MNNSDIIRILPKSFNRSPFLDFISSSTIYNSLRNPKNLQRNIQNQQQNQKRILNVNAPVNIMKICFPVLVTVTATLAGIVEASSERTLYFTFNLLEMLRRQLKP